MLIQKTIANPTIAQTTSNKLSMNYMRDKKHFKGGLESKTPTARDIWRSGSNSINSHRFLQVFIKTTHL